MTTNPASAQMPGAARTAPITASHPKLPPHADRKQRESDQRRQPEALHDGRDRKGCGENVLDFFRSRYRRRPYRIDLRVNVAQRSVLGTHRRSRATLPTAALKPSAYSSPAATM